MTEDTRKFVEEKTKEILNAGSCCPELKEMAEKWLFLLDEVFIFPYNELVIPCVVQYVLMKAHCYCVGRANNSYQYSHKLEIDKILRWIRREY